MFRQFFYYCKIVTTFSCSNFIYKLNLPLLFLCVRLFCRNVSVVIFLSHFVFHSASRHLLIVDWSHRYNMCIKCENSRIPCWWQIVYRVDVLLPFHFFHYFNVYDQSTIWMCWSIISIISYDCEATHVTF